VVGLLKFFPLYFSPFLGCFVFLAICVIFGFLLLDLVSLCWVMLWWEVVRWEPYDPRPVLCPSSLHGLCHWSLWLLFPCPDCATCMSYIVCSISWTLLTVFSMEVSSALPSWNLLGCYRMNLVSATNQGLLFWALWHTRTRLLLGNIAERSQLFYTPLWVGLWSWCCWYFFTAYWFKAWPVPFLVDRMSIKGYTFFVCPISVLCSVRLLLCVFCTGFISTPRCILGRTARLCLWVRLRMVLVQFRGAQLYFTSKNMFLNDPLGSLATFFVVFHQLF